MATYGQLLIDAGGGVVDHGKQSPRQDGATLIIGLGGTGADAVMKLKKEVYKQLQPDDMEAVIPRYNAIKYLIIDSDDSKILGQNGRITDIDRNTEFFSVANNTIKATFAATEVLKGRKELDWLDFEHISIDDASKGAGGIRQVGRFLLVDKAAQLYATIKNAMMSALTYAKSGGLHVHICAGISGGTGSGTFLDVCYLVRQALYEMGKSDASVCGYFFLPDVNLSVPEIRKNPLIQDYIKVNGFSALQELDYCMNFGKNNDQFEMNYGFMKIARKEHPVDLCYLVSTTNSDNVVVQNGYQYAMGVVTDFIISFLAKVQLPPGVDPKDNGGLTLEGHISNLNSIKAGIKLQHGAGLDYNILGASIAEMPLSEIATYLGAALFEKYQGIYSRVPAESERDEFLNRARLTYNAIREQLTSNCRKQVPFGDGLDAKMYKETGNHKFVAAGKNYYSNNSGELEKNKRTMMEALTVFGVPDNSTSLISRTYKCLFEYFVGNLGFGPFFARNMIAGGNNQNLIHAVDGMILQNQKNLQHERNQDGLREEEYRDASNRMDNASMLNSGKRIEEYKNALNNLYVHRYKLEVYEMLDEILQTYKKQLIALDKDLFSVLCNVMETLNETFIANKEDLSKRRQNNNNYVWKILDIVDIQDELDEAIKHMDLGQTMYRLMMMLFENTKRWLGQDEGEISKLISDFIIEEFRSATQKTMTDYLKVKFNASNDALLVDAIADQILQQQLAANSSPMFWQNPMYPKDRVGKQCTLSVPYDQKAIKDAAEQFKGGRGEFTIRHTGIIDKISMMQFFSGFPMYAYQGLMDLQQAYAKDNKPGRHLYERGELNWNKFLPSPVPESFKVDIPIDAITERNEALKAEFAEALARGVVVKDGKNWDIMETPGVDVAAVVPEIAGKGVSELTAYTAPQLKAFSDAINAAIDQSQAAAKPTRIQYLNANEGVEEQIMMDFYLLAPKLNQMVKDELNRRAAADKLKADLAEAMSVGGEAEREKKDFLTAIFTGVLKYGKKITFTYDSYGIDETIDLQTRDMEFGNSGAYQAFLTFQGLDPKMKSKIVKMAQDLAESDEDPQVLETLESLEAKMKIRIETYRDEYENSLKYDEIKAFYETFMHELRNFARNYRL